VATGATPMFLHRPRDRAQEGLIHRAAQRLQGEDMTPQDPEGILGLPGIQGPPGGSPVATGILARAMRDCRENPGHPRMQRRTPEDSAPQVKGSPPPRSAHHRRTSLGGEPGPDPWSAADHGGACSSGAVRELSESNGSEDPEQFRFRGVGSCGLRPRRSKSACRRRPAISLISRISSVEGSKPG
jgi:hypothetical protein